MVVGMKDITNEQEMIPFLSTVSDGITKFINNKYKLKFPVNRINQLFLAKNCPNDGGTKGCSDLYELHPGQYKGSFNNNSDNLTVILDLSEDILSKYTHLVRATVS